MSTTTTNYGLIKPDTTDPILIGQLNDNADAIDAALKENADAIENKPDAADIPTPSTVAPAMDGTAAAGTSTDYARADHIHPSDTSKQDTLTAAQLAAVNSGIDSAKVGQIETNKNNILKDEATIVELVDGGAKNFINVEFTSKTATATTPSISNNGDGSITFNGSNTGNNPIIVRDICSDLTASQDTRYSLPTGVYELCGTGNEDVVLQVYMHDGTSANLTQLAQASISSTVEFTYTSDLKSTYPYICFRLYIKVPTASHEVSFDNVVIRPMVCTKAAWDISHEYQPYRPSYQELYEMVKALQAQLANQ